MSNEQVQDEWKHHDFFRILREINQQKINYGCSQASLDIGIASTCISVSISLTFMITLSLEQLRMINKTLFDLQMGY